MMKTDPDGSKNKNLKRLFDQASELFCQSIIALKNYDDRKYDTINKEFESYENFITSEE